MVITLTIITKTDGKKTKNRVGIKDMSLKKLVKEMAEPIVEDIGGIVASDGTIKGGSKLSKIKKYDEEERTHISSLW